MDTCRRLAQLLDDYLTGRLPTRQMRELEAHLAGCADCYRFVDSYRKVIRLGGTLPREPMPAELVLELRALMR